MHCSIKCDVCGMVKKKRYPISLNVCTFSILEKVNILNATSNWGASVKRVKLYGLAKRNGFAE